MKQKGNNRKARRQTRRDKQDEAFFAARGTNEKEYRVQALPKLEPKNQTQAEYIQDLKDFNQVIAIGPAGTGKTFVAAAYAATQYHKTRKMSEEDGGLHKIILTRPNVSVGKTNGHLPGTIEEKSLPWAVPLTEAIQKHLEKGTFETAMKNKDIDFVPVEFVRGRTFNNSFIIIDEAQNLTRVELKAILTRIGTHSTLVLCGDINQCDIHNSGLSRLVELVDLHRSSEISVIEFDVEDCVRSPAAKRWIELFRDFDF
jgi:phosphate starvation-inducible PhoH-like protein